jgi:6-phosphofructokinase 1
MGRDAGHLALGAAKSAGATLALVPEEFSHAPLRLARIARIVEGAILKRLANGRSHGVAVIAEGIGGLLPEQDVPGGIPRDKHDRPVYSDLPLGDLVAKRAQAGLAELGISVSVVDKDVGYELRCAAPNAFDVEYTRDLGAGAVDALLSGASGVMITREEQAIVRVPFADMLDRATGRTRTRLLDTRGHAYATARLLQVRLEPADLTPGPECDALVAATKRSPDALRARYFGDAG